MKDYDFDGDRDADEICITADDSVKRYIKVFYKGKEIKGVTSININTYILLEQLKGE